jgi:four helix bundle protein
MQDFRRLQVWEKAHALSLDIERVCNRFPRRQGAVLANQLRRAMASVPANIVEGAAKRSDREFRRFLDMAMSSAHEADYHLLTARDTRLLGERSYTDLTMRLLEVRRMLGGLIKRITISLEGNAGSAIPPDAKKPNTGSATHPDTKEPNSESTTPSETKQPKFRDAVRYSDQRKLDA